MDQTNPQTLTPPPGAPPPGPDVQPAQDVTPNAGIAKGQSPLAPQSPFAQSTVPQPYQDESAAYARKAADDKAAWEKRQALWTPVEEKLRKELLAGNPPPPEQQRLPAPPSMDPQRYQQNALAFLGAMAALGALAGRFTRQSGEAANNAFAGAMKGWQTGNLEAYEQKSKEWEQTTKQMLENNKMVLEKYKAVLENKSLNIDEQMMAAKLIAAEYQDKIAFDALDAGNYTMFAQLHDKQTAAQDKAVESFLKLSGDKFHETEQNQAKAKQLETPEGQAWMQGLDPASQMKLQGFLKVYGSGAPQLSSTGASGSGARNQIFSDWKTNYTQQNGRAPSPDEEKRFLQSMTTVRSAPAMTLQKFIEENPNATSEQITQFAGHYSVVQKAEKDFSTGKQGQMVNSLNVAISHVETLRELGAALQNGDITAFNKLAQNWAAQTGSSAPTNFDTAKQIVGGEIMKALVAGGGGQSERDELRFAFDRAMSPQALGGAINTAERLLAGQFRGLKKQYETTTGLTDFEQAKMTDEALGIFKRYPTSESAGGGAGGPASGAVIKYDAQGNRVQ
jgi:hypothetical protein